MEGQWGYAMNSATAIQDIGRRDQLLQRVAEAAADERQQQMVSLRTDSRDWGAGTALEQPVSISHLTRSEHLSDKQHLNEIRGSCSLKIQPVRLVRVPFG